MASRDFAFLMFINVVWGLAMIAAAASLKHFPPLMFTCLRFFLISVMLVPFLRWHEGRMTQIFWIAMTAGTFNFALLFLGVHWAGEVGAVSIAGQLGVPFTTILSIIVLGEIVRWRRWLGILLAFSGVIVIGFDPKVMVYINGFLAVVAAALVGSVSSILMRQVKEIPVFEMQALIATFSWPVLLVMSLMFEGDQAEASRTAGLIEWGGVAYVACMSSLVAHAGFYWLLQRYEVSKITPLTLISPLFTVVFGVILLGEELTWRIVLGGAITLVGVVIISLREPERVREPVTR